MDIYELSDIEKLVEEYEELLSEYTLKSYSDPKYKKIAEIYKKVVNDFKFIQNHGDLSK